MSVIQKPTITKLEQWIEKWENSQIAFHQENRHPFLVNNLKKLTINDNEKVRVLFPLCGKSVDMAWLASLGHSVIGIEISQLACEQFFNENNMKYSKINLQEFILYLSEDERIKIYNGDFFKFNLEIEEPFECVWDRGAYVALFYELRIKYTEHVKKILNKKTKYLLEVFEYDTTLYPGPPFSCTEEEIKRLFGPNFKIDFIESRYFNPFGNLLVENKHPLEKLYFISKN